MKHLLALLTLMGVSLQAHADIFAVFRYDDGSTNWQYIANTSASLLIIILLVVLGFLIRANLRARRSNRALTEIKATLEERVAQRTQVLQETAEQLRKREAYIASIVNSMPVMLAGINDKLQVTQWNKTAEEFTGRPYADVVGENLWKAYPGITLTEEQVQGVLDSGETLHLKHTQRGQYTYDITLYRLKHNDETGIVILISDVTKQVNAENKVAERDKLSALGELASAMAFDISRPIDTILQRVDRSRERLDASELGEVKTFLLKEVDVVGQSARQANAIAQNLLDLSRGHRDVKQSASIPAIMDRSIALAAELLIDVDGLDFKDVDIRRDYADDLPEVACYPNELQQVFMRVLRSAFYAVKPQADSAGAAPQIKVGIGKFFDSVWVKIEHRGQVLSEQAQLCIFEPFFASAAGADECPVEQRLSYPYFIVTEHHRGHMSVTSYEELGTTFNIQLSLV
jgi:PAS domain S-box-containing protein